MDEFSFIASLLAPLATDKGALGLKDDAAVLDVPAGQQLVITKDALVSGVHFIGDEPPSPIAKKLLAVNLSDLAAMGAAPRGYFLALMLPPECDEAWLRDFTAGLKEMQDQYGIALLGGDTTRTPGPLGLSVTMLGLVPQGAALLRSGAKAGDGIYVSGALGDAALGLEVARGKLPENEFLLNRYRLPRPRLVLGMALRGIANACMDISDGLVQDLSHICAASGVGAEIHFAEMPLSDAGKAMLKGREDALAIVLAGGDDYELLFTMPDEKAGKVTEPVTRIGTIINGNGVKVLGKDGKEIVLERTGYRHF